MRKVTLLANGKPLETKQVKVPANGRATVEFLTLDAPYGLTRCEVQIDGADAFPAGRPLAVLGGARRPQAGAAGACRRRHGEPALCPDGARIVDRSRLSRWSRCRPNQAANVNVPKYAFVILSDPGPLPEKLEDALEKYVQDGGSVLMTLGKNATPGRHLPLADLQVMGLHTIVPDRESHPDRGLGRYFLSRRFRARRTGAAWSSIRRPNCNLPQASPDTRVAATAVGRLAACSSIGKIGEGHALVFTSALDNIANNLPLEPVWLPFLDQTTHEMGGIGTAPGNYKVGSFVESADGEGKRRSGRDRRARTTSGC